MVQRTDYVYLIRTSTCQYVGQALTPGRALQHTFDSHNTALNAAIDADLKIKQEWPELFVLKLATPSLEDLTAMESAIIHAAKWIEGSTGLLCVNRNLGPAPLQPYDNKASINDLGNRAKATASSAGRSM